MAISGVRPKTIQYTNPLTGQRVTENVTPETQLLYMPSGIAFNPATLTPQSSLITPKLETETPTTPITGIPATTGDLGIAELLQAQRQSLLPLQQAFAL